MTMEQQYPLQPLSQWLESTRHRIREWVRKEIIDDDPYEIEVCWDGEFLMVESGRILDISDLEELDLDEFLQYLIVERRLSSAPIEKNKIFRPLDRESMALATLLQEEFALAKQAVCAQISLYPTA